MAEDHPYQDMSKDVEIAEGMNESAQNAFAKVYPLLAEQVTHRYGIKKGKCIDIGSGPGTWPIALAKITDLHIYAVDKSPHCKIVVARNVKAAGLEGRITAVESGVEKLPFEDDSIDLIISRSSVVFWDDLKAAFNEIYRVLKPSGKTYIGAGFGDKKLKDDIFARMEEKKPGWAAKRKELLSSDNQDRIETGLKESNVSKYEIHRTTTGFWICISKV